MGARGRQMGLGPPPPPPVEVWGPPLGLPRVPVRVLVPVELVPVVLALEVVQVQEAQWGLVGLEVV